jgi:hypothetical protein
MKFLQFRIAYINFFAYFCIGKVGNTAIGTKTITDNTNE